VHDRRDVHDRREVHDQLGGTGEVWMMIPLGNIHSVTLAIAWGMYLVLLVALCVVLLRGDGDSGSPR
jgi:hypothetical protein